MNLKLQFASLVVGALAVSTLNAPVHPIVHPVVHKPIKLIIRSSWYCDGFEGHLTANGEKYDCDMLTVAHKDYPLGTKLILRNPENDHEVLVRVNDRGPYVDGRGLDCSRRVAELLGFEDKGVALLELTVVKFGNNHYSR